MGVFLAEGCFAEVAGGGGGKGLEVSVSIFWLSLE